MTNSYLAQEQEYQLQAYHQQMSPAMLSQRHHHYQHCALINRGTELDTPAASQGADYLQAAAIPADGHAPEATQWASGADAQNPLTDKRQANLFDYLQTTLSQQQQQQAPEAQSQPGTRQADNQHYYAHYQQSCYQGGANNYYGPAGALDSGYSSQHASLCDQYHQHTHGVGFYGGATRAVTPGSSGACGQPTSAGNSNTYPYEQHYYYASQTQVPMSGSDKQTPYHAGAEQHQGRMLSAQPYATVVSQYHPGDIYEQHYSDHAQNTCVTGTAAQESTETANHYASPQYQRAAWCDYQHAAYHTSEQQQQQQQQVQLPQAYQQAVMTMHHAGNDGSSLLSRAPPDGREQSTSRIFSSNDATAATTPSGSLPTTARQSERTTAMARNSRERRRHRRARESKAASERESESLLVLVEAATRSTRAGRAASASPNSSGAERQNQCHICNRHYARPSTLKTHLRTHTNERPYKCAVCFKTFSQAANLTAHQRVHTGERPFPCPICGRQFSQSSSVITHLRTHSGERPYRCNMCNRTFSDSSTLTKHCRIHSGEKPYQCDFCPLNFSQSGNLSRHLRLHSLVGSLNRNSASTRSSSNKRQEHLSVASTTASSSGAAHRASSSHLSGSPPVSASCVYSCAQVSTGGSLGSAPYSSASSSSSTCSR